MTFRSYRSGDWSDEYTWNPRWRVLVWKFLRLFKDIPMRIPNISEDTITIFNHTINYKGDKI